MATQPERIILGYQASTQDVRRRLEAYLAALWDGMGSYRDADIDRMIRQALPRVQASQRRTAGLTDAYLAALAGTVALGVNARSVVGEAARPGIAPEDAYRRPGVTVWTQLSRGADVATAVAAGRRRLLSLGATDLQLSKRVQEQRSMAATGQQFYRRVLTGNENCALCVVASTQRYNVGTLKPIHPGCDCDVATIEGVDPGRIINERRLVDLQSAVDEELGNRDPGARNLGQDKRDKSGKRLSDYTDLIVTREHGEYGPTLAWRSDKFTGPDDLAA